MQSLSHTKLPSLLVAGSNVQKFYLFGKNVNGYLHRKTYLHIETTQFLGILTWWVFLIYP